MHFDTDANDKTLNEEFFDMFGEVPPKVVVDTFNQIGNPVTRMTRMYDLIGRIVKGYEIQLNMQQDHFANYRILPKEFDLIFHQGRRKSSNEMNDSHTSFEIEEPALQNKEASYS